MARCGFHKDEDGSKHWIPGCWGGVIYGKDGCTCYRPITGKKGKALTISELERECAMLRNVNENLNRRNRELLERIREIERKGTFRK